MPSRAALKGFLLGIEEAEEEYIYFMAFFEDSEYGRMDFVLTKTKLLKYLEYQEQVGLIDTEHAFKYYGQENDTESLTIVVKERLNKEKEEIFMNSGVFVSSLKK